jgi:hypothetical protein
VLSSAGIPRPSQRRTDGPETGRPGCRGHTGAVGFYQVDGMELRISAQRTRVGTGRSLLGCRLPWLGHFVVHP